MSSIYKFLYKLSDDEFAALVAANNKNVGKKLASQRDLENQAIARGCSFSDTYQYIKALTKVDLICPNNHPFSINPADFKNGKGCGICAGNNSKYAREEFEKIVISKGYQFGDLYEYKNTDTRVHLICPIGHSIMVIPNNLKHGSYNCIVCSGHCTVSARNEFENQVSSRGYTFGTDYKYTNVMTKVHIVCPNGHDVFITPDHFTRGVDCSICTPGGFNPGKPAHFYIQTLSSNGKVVGLKFGITNKPVKTRLQSQQSKSKFDHLVVLDATFEAGSCAYLLEKYVKGVYPCGYVSKNDMPRGYTETISPDFYTPLMNDICSFMNGDLKL